MDGLGEALPRLKRGCVDLVSEEELRSKLSVGRPLRVKLGVDPTSPDLHLGHAVVLSKLRLFQDLGHTAVLIIGDFTAAVGDPSGRDSTRPTLTQAEIRANAKTYQEQAFKVLDPARVELRFNSEWLDPYVRQGRLLEGLKSCTAGQLLAREDFQARMKAQSPITLLELLYPVFQGYDSVAVRADVELGGNDQLFNLLFGRQMQKTAGQPPQCILTLPLLVGSDGRRKMSKSYGNHIALNDSARDMFGKVMRLSDELMASYYELLTDDSLDSVRGMHPMEAKKRLAGLLTARYHGPEAAAAERAYFEQTFSQGKDPEEAPEFRVGSEELALAWSVLLVRMGAAPSRKQAQRLIAQGAVRLSGEALKEDCAVSASIGGQDRATLKVGKHGFYRLIKA
jgi:tyrosyl-tRNA synthetase